MSAVTGLEAVVERLVRSSRDHEVSPYGAIDWPDALDPSRDWFLSPELSSLAGTEIWDRLDEAGRRRLTFAEAANFFSLNIHGERILMQGIAARLYRDRFLGVSDYLHHFLDEENKHSVHFGQFCRRYARVYPSRHVHMSDPSDGAESDVLFFARVLAFEEIVDRYNVVQARDERLHPVARQINAGHHADEARHLVFGRYVLRELWDRDSAGWDGATRHRIAIGLEQFIDATWREYYNPAVYADAGLDAPWDVAREAWASPAQQAHRARMSARCRAFLTDVGMLEGADHGQ
jgi:hypothetical protein